LKILHLPYCFYPDAVGGTEIYVAALARELLVLGHETVIVAPGRCSETYTHEKIKVIRLKTSEGLSLDALYGAGDAQVAEQFAKVLTDEKPDMVHMHAFTSGVSIQLARIVKAKGIRIVLTYHTPTVTCPRGTMMRWGSTPCHGHMDLSKCVSCTLQGKGLPQVTAEVLSTISAVLGSSIRTAQLEGRLWTALRMHQLIQSRFDVTHELFSLCDHVVAAADWVKGVLMKNTVPAEKITVLKQGLCHSEEDTANSDSRMCENDSLKRSVLNNADTTRGRPVKLAFLGRLDPTKGLHVVAEALDQEPRLNLRLDIYGVKQGESRNSYEEQLFKMVCSDTRIHILPKLLQSQVVQTLCTYDALLVPSQWMETGPMVVLEAFAAGIPVIGSNLGGIRDFVRNDVDGILIPFSNIEKWRDVLRQISTDAMILLRLKKNVKQPETMQTVARDMQDIYKQVLVNSN